MIFQGVKAELLVPTVTVINPTETKSSTDDGEVNDDGAAE